MKKIPQMASLYKENKKYVDRQERRKTKVCHKLSCFSARNVHFVPLTSAAFCGNEFNSIIIYFIQSMSLEIFVHGIFTFFFTGHLWILCFLLKGFYLKRDKLAFRLIGTEICIWVTFSATKYIWYPRKSKRESKQGSMSANKTKAMLTSPEGLGMPLAFPWTTNLPVYRQVPCWSSISGGSSSSYGKPQRGAEKLPILPLALGSGLQLVLIKATPRMT